MNPGLGASYAFYRGDRSPVQGADGDQTGIGGMMASECKRETQSKLYPVGDNLLGERSPSTSNMAGFVQRFRHGKYLLSSVHAQVLEPKYTGFLNRTTSI